MRALPFRLFFTGLLFGWLLSFAGPGYAQQITLNGRVSDAKTALPVEGVSVNLSPGRQVTVTSSKGTFTLKTDSVSAAATLTFSHLGYETFTVNLQPRQTQYHVKLLPKNNRIPEVTITALKKLNPAKLRPETVVDYALRGDQVFVLAWEKAQEKPSLLVLDRQTDSLQQHYRLPFYVESLFTDCLANVHLLTATQAYQLNSETDSLRFEPPHAREAFEQFILPCATATTQKIYFRKNINQGVVVSYFSVDRLTAETNRLQTVADEIVLTMQSNERRFQFFRAGAGDPSMSMNRGPWSAGVNTSFAKKVMFEAPYVPLLKIGGQVCLFDHANGKLELYQNDSLTRTLPITYQLQKDFAREILVDAPEQKAYALFRKHGLAELKLLNLATGVTETTYRLSNPFAEKISVQNGQVYFLYKEPKQNSRQFLYKAPLRNF